MIDLLEQEGTGFLLDSDGDIATVVGIDQVIQDIRTRLRTFLGECAFNITEGMPFIEEIFVKSPDNSFIDSLFKAKIVETKDVVEITFFESEINTQSRTYTMRATIATIYGEGYIEEVVS